jgi:hypothetical protein
MGQFIHANAKKNFASATILASKLNYGKRLAYLMLCAHVESGPQHSSLAHQQFGHISGGKNESLDQDSPRMLTKLSGYSTSNHPQP